MGRGPRRKLRLEKKNVYRAPALEKGLDILEALSVSSVPQTLTQLSRSMNRSPSELFRMIGLLERRGYVIKDNDGYFLSLKLYELAHTHSPMDHLLKAAREPMRELAVITRESCHLSVIEHGELLVLAQEESPEKVRLSLEVGGRFSALETASGRVLLAHQDKDELEAFLAAKAAFASEDEKLALMNELEDIRRKGYCIAEDESHVGVRDLAVLVGNPQIGVMAALTSTSLATKKNRREMNDSLSAIQAQANRITINLGLSTTLLLDDPLA